MVPTPPQRLLTFKNRPEDGWTEPWRRPKFETIDYVLSMRRWKNAVTDVESDVGANINTDHAPLMAKIRIKLKNVKE